jgi:predicted nucleotidyltransferase
MHLSEENKRILQQFFSNKPVEKAYLFRSYARKDANKNSDIDILVELDYSKPIGMKFFGFQPELEDLLKKKVDIVSFDSPSPYVKPFIDKDKIMIYERQTI